MVEREFLNKLVHRHYFRVVARVPAKKSEEVDNGMREVAAFTIARGYIAGFGVVPFEGENRESETVAVALGEFAFAVGFEQERQVDKCRHGVDPAECFVEQHVERSRWKPFFAADYMRHFHQVVVDDICKMVGWQVIGRFIQHLVVENIALDHYFATDKVVDLDISARLDAEAHHILGAFVEKAFHFVGGQRKGVAHRHTCRRIVLEIRSGGSGGFEFGGSVERNISLSGIEEHAGVLAIDVAAFALLVWAVRASFTYAFVYFNTEPCECLVDIIFGSGHETLGVGVFNTENHLAAMLAREKVVIKGCADTSDMERPRGRGGETHSYF